MFNTRKEHFSNHSKVPQHWKKNFQVHYTKMIRLIPRLPLCIYGKGETPDSREKVQRTNLNLGDCPWMGRYVFFGFWRRSWWWWPPPQPGVGVAINVLYLSHTFLAQILCPLVFPPHISLLVRPPQLLPLFCAFYPTFAPAFSQTHFCGAAQEYKWSKMKKRGRQHRGDW